MPTNVLHLISAGARVVASMTELIIIAALAGWSVAVALVVLYKRAGRWRPRALELQHALSQSQTRLQQLTWLDEDDEPTNPGVRIWD